MTTKIGTHSGSFHADEVLGVSVLRTVFAAQGIETQLMRSRDAAVLAECDYLVDVGGVYDVAAHRFDHHQKGFAERRDSGLPYAGAGLVWRTYGAAFVQAVHPQASAEMAETVAQIIDSQFIAWADAVDNGIDVDGPIAFGFSSMISRFNGTWLEVRAAEEDDARFEMACQFADPVLRNLVRDTVAEQLARQVVMQAPVLAEGRIVVLDQPRLPFDDVIVNEMPAVLFVVYPESSGQQYQVRVVLKKLGSFDARQDLPAAWGGLRGADLAVVSGVSDAVFCHNGLFIAGALSKEGAIALAMNAL